MVCSFDRCHVDTGAGGHRGGGEVVWRPSSKVREGQVTHRSQCQGGRDLGAVEWLWTFWIEEK